MAATNEIINKIIEIGPVIIIPSILFLIGFITTRNPLRNLKNSAFIFVGMLGFSIVLTLFINFFEPLINTIIANSSKNFEIVDIGWAASREIIFNSPITLHIIAGVFALNIIMLFLRLTRTINIDIWHYWILLLVGSIIFTITEIRWIGVLIALIIAAVTLVLADIYAFHIENYSGIKGISNPQTQVITWAPVTQFVNFIFNRIPGLRKVHIFYEEIQYKLGFFSEPLVFGFFSGFLIGIITKYTNFQLNLWPNILYALLSGFELAVILVLMPRVVTLMLKGLHPAINDIRDFISRKITKRVLYVGIDSIFFAGMPSVIGLSIIVIPLTVYIATLLPGNNILPGADLIIIPFILVWAVSISQGDIFRSFISAVIIIPMMLWITTDMATLFTSFVQKYNIVLAEAHRSVSSFGSGSNLLFWVLLQIIKPILNFFS